jgi:hypothetical protein
MYSAKASGELGSILFPSFLNDCLCVYLETTDTVTMSVCMYIGRQLTLLL